MHDLCLFGAHDAVTRYVLAGLGLIALAVAGDAAAQTKPPRHDAAGDEVVVTGRRIESCPAPSAGGGHGIDYGCLNRALKTAASAGQPLAPAIDATTVQANVPSRVGTFSFAATAERMGRNFGHSATPYRPPPPVYGHGASGARPSPGGPPR